MELWLPVCGNREGLGFVEVKKHFNCVFVFDGAVCEDSDMFFVGSSILDVK